MFKFQRFFSGGSDWVDNLFFEEKHIGTIGFDKEGLYLKSKRQLTLKELNLLVAQISMTNPSLLNEKIEIIELKDNEEKRGQ